MTKLVTLSVAALALAGVAGASTGPSLRLASTRPFVVQGRQFKGSERVVVTLTVRRQRIVRRATATPDGTWRVGFGTVALDACSAYAVRAAGLSGDVALLRRPPLPACLPAKTP